MTPAAMHDNDHDWQTVAKLTAACQSEPRMLAYGTSEWRTGRRMAHITVGRELLSELGIKRGDGRKLRVDVADGEGYIAFRLTPDPVGYAVTWVNKSCSSARLVMTLHDPLPDMPRTTLTHVYIKDGAIYGSLPIKVDE